MQKSAKPVHPPSAPADIPSWRRLYQAYLFDLDGTLIDTAPDLHVALNHTLRSHNYPEVSLAHTRHWIGHGGRAMVAEALKHHHKAAQGNQFPASNLDERLDEMMEVFLTYYEQHASDQSEVYPGVIETLDQLQALGAKLAVVTNKITRFTLPILENLGLAARLDAIVCGDTAERPKPDAAPVLYCLDALQTGASNALFVGDSLTDVTAANAAAVTVVCVRDGYNHGADVTELPLAGVIDHFSELLPPT